MTSPKNRQTQKQNKTLTDADLQQLLGGHQMPASPESERAVLGSMLLDRECIGDVVQIINADCFHMLEHRIIFETIVSLYDHNSEIDPVLVAEALKARQYFDAVGGHEFLVRVVESVPTSANAEYYANIVKDKSMVRELARVCGQIIQDACDEAGDVKEKLDVAEKLIFEVTEKKIEGSVEHIQGLINQVFENFQSRKGHHGTLGHPTGYTELDDLLNGLHRGEMIIVAGRPSMGKTSFALNVAEYMGVVEELPIAIFSLEMGKEQLVERFLCSRSGVDSQRVRRGMFDDADHQKLQEAAGEFYNKPIYIDDSPGMTPLMIRAKSRRLKSRYGIQAIFIDYLQLMALGGRIESRQQEISTISRYLKSLARELDVPVVVLSQLNRAVEGREGHRPRMSDLRESGSIEQDADVIMLLHREAYYKRSDPDYDMDDPEANMAEVIIAKQRNGPTGTVQLVFDGATTRFKTRNYSSEPF